MDLFSGTGSVSKALEAEGYEVTSVDIGWEADIRVDILAWDYKSMPSGSFDLVWASPPCTEYSRAKTVGFRDYETADKLVRKACDIIAYFKPKKWFLENPRWGNLRLRPMLKGMPYVDVDYCPFERWGSQKPTRVWGTVEGIPACFAHKFRFVAERGTPREGM